MKYPPSGDVKYFPVGEMLWRFALQNNWKKGGADAVHIYSLAFLLVFLPLSAAVYYAAPQRYRVPVLFVISLLFYVFLSPVGLVIMTASVGMDYLLSRPLFLWGKGDRRARLLLLAAAAKNILLFVVLSSFSQLWGVEMPIGVVVYAFTSLGYLVDLYNEEADLAGSFSEYGLFCCFFGKIYVGPILSFGDFSGQVRDLRPSLTRIGEGAVFLIQGLAKKIVLADNLALLADQLRNIPYLDKTVLSVWMFIICVILQIYYTLSGFSDMARGIGGIFGLDLPENFHYPLQSESVSDFFSRFNISANRFVRKYVYGALGAEDNGPLATTLNIMLITMLMGLWYGVRLSYLVWGGSLGVFIVLETLWEDRFFARLPALLRRLYTQVVIIVSFAWYSCLSIPQGVFYLQTMFGFRTLDFLRGFAGNTTYAMAWSDQSLYLLTQNWLLLAASGLLCTSVIYRNIQRLRLRFPIVMEGVTFLINILLLGLSLAFMVG